MSKNMMNIQTIRAIRGLYIPEEYTEKDSVRMSLLLDQYVDIVPDISLKMKQALFTLEYDNFNRLATHLAETSKKVYADNLAYDCKKIMELVNERKQSVCEILLQQMIANMSTLSISIQSAQLNGNKANDSDNLFQQLEHDIHRLQHALQNFDGQTSEQVLNEIVRKKVPLNLLSVVNVIRKQIGEYDFDAAIEQCKELVRLVLMGTLQERNSEKEPYIVLAVDDKPDVLNSLKAMIPSQDYKFFGVTSGEAALRFLEKHEPDIAILDIEMPGMDGFALAHKIKLEMKKEFPVIFLTGNGRRDEVLKAFSVGAVDFLVKPAIPEYVLLKLQEHIK